MARGGRAGLHELIYFDQAQTLNPKRARCFGPTSTEGGTWSLGLEGLGLRVVGLRA